MPRAGRLDAAQLALAKGLAYAKTHLAFISAAFFIDRGLDPGHWPNWQP